MSCISPEDVLRPSPVRDMLSRVIGTWKAEYLYVTWNARFTDNIVRVGLNYRFN